MAGFLLYQPDGQGDCLQHPALKNLQRAGDCELKVLPSRKGPDGETGSLLYFHDETRAASWPKVEYSAKSQTWKRGPGGAWWLGWSNKQRPTPDDLKRNSERADGYWCQLNDGNRWVPPCGPMLPIDFDVGDNGTLIEVVKTPGRETYEATQQAFRWASELIGRDKPMHAGINYRITPAIAVMLGLFDPDSLWRCLLLTTDANAINALIDDVEKKVESLTGDGHAISSGESDSAT